MENEIFREPIDNDQGLYELNRLLAGPNKYIYALHGLLSCARALFLYAIAPEVTHKLVVVSSENEARKLFDEYCSFDKESRFYPAKDFLFYGADLRSNELTSERVRVIKDILRNDRVTIFTSIDAILGKLPAKNSFTDCNLTINIGDTIDLGNLSKNLVDMGYERHSIVSSPGDFCIRGGIIDIFPITEHLPYRIELWSDEVDSIRIFDADTQKSIENIETASVFPASEEILFDNKKISLLPDFFPEDTCVFLDDPIHLLELAESVYEEFIDGMAKRESVGLIKEGERDIMVSPLKAFESLQSHKGLAFVGITDMTPPVKIKSSFSVKTHPVMSFNNSIPLLKKEIKNYKKKGLKTVICGQSRTRLNRLKEGLSEDNIEIITAISSISSGVEFSDGGVVFVSENDIFGGVYKRRKKKAFKKGEAIESFRELNIGDYIVHENYGMGIYLGIEKIEQDKVTKDYIKISYAGSDNLYVPVSQLDIITKYAGSEGKVKLNSLSGNEWKKTKARVKGAVDDIAKELVELYALRKQERGYVYSKDSTWQQEFEETFPYEETPGQLAAIEDVKADLMSNKIMDRLICGDVGFGKTEIALRAAFKVVQENKQVVVLVPTTVLAQQHFNTFTERMKDYPVTVGLLSRFRTPAQNEETVRRLKTGEIDIVIGTHRALSKDVNYKDLGLLVIDEEQRFGVKHKEKIKQLKNSVDVLSLTATPIPRTLHMSLIGIRDMSILDEAPLERLPVQTFVFEQSDEMIREAIGRELARGGQVYYVVNRIRQIPDIASKIRALVPYANVVYAHGQMTEIRLEDIMTDFVDRQIDVLVATTIIEIGLDISNVNTIIIHDADNFGLSQLYQLRGRVGRSNRTAYAFLMYRRDKLLKEVAKKRLKAIREFSELGSGFKIAMRDLEIRGAGNLLGSEQHGHMDAVGYDLYCKLLATALKAEKGEDIIPDFETSIDITIDAHIPREFIEDEAQKLEIYRRISLISDDESEEVMIDELIDRFGDPPKAIINLIRISRLREIAHRTYITKIFQSGDSVKIDLFPQAKLDAQAIPSFVENHKDHIRFVADAQAPGFYVRISKDKSGTDILSYLNFLVKNMNECLLPHNLA